MAQRTLVEGWMPTLEQRAAFQQGLEAISEARKLLSRIRAYDPKLAGFADKHEAWAEAVEQSFNYFLNGPYPIHPAYVFTAEISEPEALMYRIRQLMILFDIPKTA